MHPPFTGNGFRRGPSLPPKGDSIPSEYFGIDLLDTKSVVSQPKSVRVADETGPYRIAAVKQALLCNDLRDSLGIFKRLFRITQDPSEQSTYHKER